MSPPSFTSCVSWYSVRYSGKKKTLKNLTWETNEEGSYRVCTGSKNYLQKDSYRSSDFEDRIYLMINYVSEYIASEKYTISDRCALLKKWRNHLNHRSDLGEDICTYVICIICSEQAKPFPLWELFCFCFFIAPVTFNCTEADSTDSCASLMDIFRKHSDLKLYLSSFWPLGGSVKP